MDTTKIAGGENRDQDALVADPVASSGTADPVPNPHVRAVLSSQEDEGFATEYEHFGSFLSWSKSG